jgi:hypothetical protein
VGVAYSFHVGFTLSFDTVALMVPLVICLVVSAVV